MYIQTNNLKCQEAIEYINLYNCHKTIPKCTFSAINKNIDAYMYITVRRKILETIAEIKSRLIIS